MNKLTTDMLDMWLQDLGQGKVSWYPTEIPDLVLARLIVQAHALLGNDYDAVDSDPTAGAAIAGLAVLVAARKSRAQVVRRKVGALLELQNAIAVQIVLEGMRRHAGFKVNWPKWGFGDLDENIEIGPPQTANP